MRIGLTIGTFTPNTGGVFKHAEDLVYELQKAGYAVVVVTRSSTFISQGCDYIYRNEVEESVCRSGIEIKHLTYSRVFRPIQWLISKLHHRLGFAALVASLYWLQARSSAVRCLRGCDIIHHVGQSCALVGFAGANAARVLEVPFLLQPTVHPNQAGDGQLDLRLFSLADRLLVHTKFEESYFRRSGFKQPVSVVGNGIPDRSDGIGQRFRERHGIRGPMVLYVGRKEPNKGYDLALQAWLLAKRKIPALNLVCIGPSCSFSRPQPQLGLFDLDFCDEQTKHDALAACDSLCVPSEGESFGLIFMEAGRYGKPVIARRLPVLIELLGDKAALLLGTGAGFNRIAVTPNEIADGIIRLLTEKAFAAELGCNLKNISSQFIWPRIIGNFTSAYQQSLNN